MPSFCNFFWNFPGPSCWKTGCLSWGCMCLFEICSTEIRNLKKSDNDLNNWFKQIPSVLYIRFLLLFLAFLIDTEISWRNCFNNFYDTSFLTRCILMNMLLLAIFFMQIDLKVSDLFHYRQSIFILFVTYNHLPAFLAKPYWGVWKFPLIFWQLLLLRFIEWIPYLAFHICIPSLRVSKLASIFWQLPYSRVIVK